MAQPTGKSLDHTLSLPSVSRKVAPSTPSFSAAVASTTSSSSTGSASPGALSPRKGWRIYSPSDRRIIPRLGGSREPEPQTTNYPSPLLPKKTDPNPVPEENKKLIILLQEKDTKMDQLETEISELQQKLTSLIHDRDITELDFEMMFNNKIMHINQLNVQLQHTNYANEQLQIALAAEKDKTKRQREELVAEKMEYRKSTAQLSKNEWQLSLAAELEAASQANVALEHKVALFEELMRTLEAKGNQLEAQLALGNSSLKEKTEECDGIRKLLVKFQEQKETDLDVLQTELQRTIDRLNRVQQEYTEKTSENNFLLQKNTELQESLVRFTDEITPRIIPEKSEFLNIPPESPKNGKNKKPRDDRPRYKRKGSRYNDSSSEKLDFELDQVFSGLLRENVGPSGIDLRNKFSDEKEKNDSDGIFQIFEKLEQAQEEITYLEQERSKTTQHISDAQKKIEIKFLELSDFHSQFSVSNNQPSTPKSNYVIDLEKHLRDYQRKNSEILRISAEQRNTIFGLESEINRLKIEIDFRKKMSEETSNRLKESETTVKKLREISGKNILNNVQSKRAEESEKLNLEAKKTIQRMENSAEISKNIIQDLRREIVQRNGISEMTINRLQSKLEKVEKKNSILRKKFTLYAISSEESENVMFNLQKIIEDHGVVLETARKIFHEQTEKSEQSEIILTNRIAKLERKILKRNTQLKEVKKKVEEAEKTPGNRFSEEIFPENEISEKKSPENDFFAIPLLPETPEIPKMETFNIIPLPKFLEMVNPESMSSNMEGKTENPEFFDISRNPENEFPNLDKSRIPETTEKENPEFDKSRIPENEFPNLDKSRIPENPVEGEELAVVIWKWEKERRRAEIAESRVARDTEEIRNLTEKNNDLMRKITKLKTSKTNAVPITGDENHSEFSPEQEKKYFIENFFSQLEKEKEKLREALFQAREAKETAQARSQWALQTIKENKNPKEENEQKSKNRSFTKNEDLDYNVGFGINLENSKRQI